jgi:tetratricopeptide (TPR) repeat protein
MKAKTVYIYIAIFVAAVVVLITVDFSGNSNSTAVTHKEMPNDAIHNGAQMPDDEIHKGMAGKMGKNDIKPQYYITLDSLRLEFEKNPSDTATAFKYAQYLTAGHGAKKAVKVFDKLLEIYPNSERVLLAATYSYYQSGEFNKADESLTKIHKLNPKDFTSYFNLGLVKLAKGDTTRAISIWKEIVQKSPNSEEGKAAKEALDSF